MDRHLREVLQEERQYTHNLAEGAGATTIMAAFKLKKRLKGKNVVLQMSGCNASPEEIIEGSKRDTFYRGFEA